MDEWTIHPQQNKNVPRQSNGYDCGMFVILCADCVVNNLPLTEASYSENLLGGYRRKLVKAILLGKLYNMDLNLNF